MNQLNILIIFLLLSIKAFSQQTGYTHGDDSTVNRMAGYRRAYVAERTLLKPRIDGKLLDECWQTTGKWDGGFVQQPRQAHPPMQQTEIKILYDDKYLYVALKCHDNEPSKMSQFPVKFCCAVGIQNRIVALCRMYP